MRKIKLNKPKLTWKHKTIISFAVILFVILGIVGIIKAINDFFDKHYFEFNKPVTVNLEAPIQLKTREQKKAEVREVVKVIESIPEYEGLETDIERYICEKFGPYDCKVAISVARAESGLREDAYNYNTNGTLDIGIFQVNEVHWDKEGCSPAELFDAKKNVDCSYKIWEAQGWTPWVAYNTGAFIHKLEE